MLKLLKLNLLTVSVLMVTPVSAQNLEEIYRQVLQADTRLLINELGVEVGVARVQQAYGSLLPQVSINSNWTENKRKSEGFNRDTYSGERYTLSIRQSVFDMPKYYSWKRSLDLSKQFSFQQKDTQSIVRLDTIERYFQLLRANDELALIHEEKEATKKKAEQIEALYKKKLVKITDFYEVTARVDMLSSQEIDAMQAVDLAKEGISELTNTSIENAAYLSDRASFAHRIQNIDDWIEKFKVGNTSLRALQKAVDAAKKNVEQQKSGRYPVIDLQLSKQKSNIGFENSLSNSISTEVAALNFTLPLYSGGSASGRISEAVQQLSLAHANYEQEYRQTIKELRDMFIGVNALVRRIEAAKKSIESAQKSYQAMNKSFSLGIATVSDVLDAQQVYSQATRTYQQAKYDYIITKSRLQHLSGTLNDEVITEINSWLM